MSEHSTEKACQIVLNGFIVLGILSMTDVLSKKHKHLTTRYIIKVFMWGSCATILTTFQIYTYLNHVYEIGEKLAINLMDRKADEKAHVKYVLKFGIYYLCAIALIGIFWYKGNDLRKYVKKLHQFEVMYLKRIGKPLPKTVSPIFAFSLVAVMVIYGTALGIIYWVWILKIVKIQSFYRSDDIMRNYCDVLWFVLCKVVYIYAKQLRVDFIEDFRNGLQDRKLRDYEKMRSLLVELTTDVGKVAGMALAVREFQEFVLVVENHYFMVLNLRNLMESVDNVEEGVSRGADFVKHNAHIAIYLTVVFLRLYICVTMAHHAETQMGDAMKEDLLAEIREQLLIPGSTKLKQAKRFLRKITSTTANIAVSKTVVLNKTFMCKVVFWTFYCSCTLLQFYDAFTLPPISQLQDNVTLLTEKLRQCENFTTVYNYLAME